MVKIKALYEGDLHTVVTHLSSGKSIHTDAPVDHEGKGENFSPTDLMTAALASCMITVVGIYAKRKEWDLKGMRIEVDKIMSTTPPRRIAKLNVEIWFPLMLPFEEQEKVKRVIQTCPVHHSLHPDIQITTTYHWGVP